MAASSLSEITDALSCSVCFEDFMNPKVLACKHVFCQRCLQKIEQGGEIQCPWCARKTNIPRGTSVGDLPEPITIRHLQDIVAKSEIPPHLKSCEMCEEDHSVTWFCATCPCYMCDGCKEEHGSCWTKGHPLQRLTPHSFCSTHPAKRITGYCTTCAQVVCVQCGFKRHSGHEIVDLDKGSNQKMTEMREEKERAASVVNVLDFQLDKMANDREQIRTQFSAVKQQLEEIKKNFISHIDTEADHLKQEYRAEMKKLDMFQTELQFERTSMESVMNYIDVVIQKDSPVDVLTMARNLPGPKTPAPILRPKLRTPRPLDVSSMFENRLSYDVYPAEKSTTRKPEEGMNTTAGDYMPPTSVLVNGPLRSTIFPYIEDVEIRCKNYLKFKESSNVMKLAEWDLELAEIFATDMAFDLDQAVIWLMDDSLRNSAVLKCDPQRGTNSIKFSKIIFGPNEAGGSGRKQKGIAVDTKRKIIITTDNDKIKLLSKAGCIVGEILIPEDVTGVAYCKELDWYVAAGKKKLFCAQAERKVIISSTNIEADDITVPRSVTTVQISEKPYILSVQWSGLDGMSKINVYPKGGAKLVRQIGQGLGRPRGMCVCPDGTLLVCDTDSKRVVKFDTRQGIYNDRGREILSPKQLGDRYPLAVTLAKDKTTYVLLANHRPDGVSYGKCLVAFSKDIMIEI